MAALALLFCGTRLAADTIYLKNQAIISTGRAWEEGEEVKYEAEGGVKSLPKSAVLRIKHSNPVMVGRAPVRLEALPAVESVAPGKAAPILPPAPGKNPVSPDAIPRLRAQLENDPAHRQAREDLIGALNAEASRLNGRGEYQEAIVRLQSALLYDAKNMTSLINLAGVQYEVGDYRSAEEVLHKAEALNDEDQYVHYLLGEVYYAQDKLDRAAREWNRALKLAGDPKVTEIVKQRLDRAEREAGGHKALDQLTGRHFILRYDQQITDYGLGQKILDHLEGLYTRLAFKLFNAPPETITVILYTREAYFNTTRAPGWSGGIYDGKIKVPVKGLTEITPELSGVLAHELTHAFIALATRRRCPAWLNEGIAQWSEGRPVTTEEQRHLSNMQRHKALWPLKGLTDSFGIFDGPKAELCYMEARSAVDYLVRLGRSDAALKKILEPLRAGASIDEALRQTMGLDLAGFEKAWTEYLLAEY